MLNVVGIIVLIRWAMITIAIIIEVVFILMIKILVLLEDAV
jgi:hypothetical protein